MKPLKITSFLFATFFASALFSQEGKVKNIILLIGDGMGTAQIYAAMSVSNDNLNIERAQYVGFSKTYSANNYITDSGAGGTAIATGKKTKNTYIAVDTNGAPIKSILKYAMDHKMSAGMVTTCDLAHATPASFVANDDSRYHCNEITLDYKEVLPDLLIGGGSHRFDSLGVSQFYKDNGYFVSYDLNSIGNKYKKDKILCLVAEEHPLPIFQGRDPNYLKDAVEIALKKLSLNDEGFFLMVEGSQIDWGGHANNLKYVMTEVYDFDKAVGVAFDFADNNPGTLVIVTADHETGGLTLPEGDLENKTVSGTFSTLHHSGVMVPIFAYGHGAKDFSGIMQNTEIFNKMMNAYGFNAD
ncbi:MAG: alkaline phosphatase [Bacteroidales bacterium]|nr:alkaline phosphatase [Bacteroidales bacterium]MBN2820036.1 alkaline phosphatase [Bacteroidales bacterium]